MPEKVWKKEPLTFEQFEDLWEQNNKLEVAKNLLTMLKESQSIPWGQKLIFLAKTSKSIATIPLYGPREYTKEDRELGIIAVRFFLEIISRWDNNFKREFEMILSALGRLSAGAQNGWESKIKTFIHSYLNNHKKEEIDEDLVVSALINNGMFEELVNYNFISSGAVECLGAVVFGGNLRLDYKKEWASNIKEALRDNREPHAVSVLLRLLAKRGDLDKIFSSEPVLRSQADLN